MVCDMLQGAIHAISGAINTKNIQVFVRLVP